ncbi:MAG TPA: alpha/beta hydrolase [Tepidisphaeraceae bacterium]|jgi:alpha/beta superfamily hydrolase|nr:alpha/beta hydrolase [Tepidisphaeraceae bacterium]
MLSPSVALPIFYLALPIAAIGIAGLRFRASRNPTPLRETLFTFIFGAVGGLIVAEFYLHAISLPPTEVASACYWGIAVACALRGVNAVLKWCIARVTPANAQGRPCCAAADVAGAIARSILLFVFAIPYVGSMVLIWRPHTVHAGTPQTLLDRGYKDISFMTSDGLRIAGWWIPAASADDPHSMPLPSGRTVIVCHDFGADKASDLKLARDLVPGDFNILAFDFRGHGQSAGQLCTFGDLERRDVLGAVKWVRENHPAESRKIYGLGVGLGSAALIAAAADPGLGRQIDAVAVFAPYDRVSNLIQGLTDAYYVPSVGWIATHVSLAMAGAQLGTPLSTFAPAQYVDKIAPRPLLVIAAEHDPLQDVSLSQAVYEQASQPKLHYWIKKGDRKAMLFKNVSASRTVRVFFETARDIL